MKFGVFLLRIEPTWPDQPEIDREDISFSRPTNSPDGIVLGGE